MKHLIYLFILINVFKVNCVPCRFVFVTNAVTKGDISTDGGDDLCITSAVNSAIEDISVNAVTYKAFLSNSTHDAGWRIGGNVNDCFKNSDGSRVADTFAEFLSPSHQNLLLDENSQLIQTNVHAWSGTSPKGIASDLTCNDFLSSSVNDLGLTGQINNIDRRWTAHTITPCSNNRRLICVESPGAPTQVTTTGHLVETTGGGCDGLMWMTDEEFDIDDLGRSGEFADELCRHSARNSPFMIGDDWQHYQALLAKGLNAPSNVVGPTLCLGNFFDRPYFKRDLPNDVFEYVQTPFVTERGTYPGLSTSWLGSVLNLTLVSNSCFDWVSEMGSAAVLSANGLVSSSCSSKYHLLCVKTPSFNGMSHAQLLGQQGARVIFATRQRFDGNLGGLKGADQKCREAAFSSEIASISANSERFFALLSTESIDGLARTMTLDSPFALDTLNFISTSGAPLFDGYTHFSSTASPNATFWRDEDGSALLDMFKNPIIDRIVTASSRGGRYSGNDCNGFTSNSADRPLFVSDSHSSWISDSRGCDDSFHLLCVELGDTPQLGPDHYTQSYRLDTPDDCYYMFRTSEKVAIDFPSLEVADARCQELARLSDLDSVKVQGDHFVAVLSNSTLSFAERLETFTLSSSQCFKNTQERLIVNSPLSLFDGEDSFQSTFWPDEYGDGTSSGRNEFALTGTEEDGFSSSLTCYDWRAGPMHVSNGAATRGFNLGDEDVFASCDSFAYIICMQVAASAPSSTTSMPGNTGTDLDTSPQTTVEELGTTSTSESGSYTFTDTSSSFTTLDGTQWSPSTTTINTDADQNIVVTTESLGDPAQMDALVIALITVGALVLCLVVAILCVVLRRRRLVAAMVGSASNVSPRSDAHERIRKRRTLSPRGRSMQSSGRSAPSSRSTSRRKLNRRSVGVGGATLSPYSHIILPSAGEPAYTELRLGVGASGSGSGGYGGIPSNNTSSRQYNDVPEASLPSNQYDLAPSVGSSAGLQRGDSQYVELRSTVIRTHQYDLAPDISIL